MIVITSYQAATIYAALEIFIQENEVAIHHGNFITDDKNYNNDLLTCYNTLEEARILLNQFAKQYGLKEKDDR